MSTGIEKHYGLKIILWKPRLKNEMPEEQQIR